MHLRLVSDSPAPTPAMPRAYAPPPAPARMPTSAFAAHRQRLALSKANADRVQPPPGGRADVTCSWDDLDLEQGVLTALEHLARGRALNDEMGKPVSRYDVQNHAGLRAAGLAGMAARIRPHLKADHPWTAVAAEVVERLAVEERHWWTLSGRRF